jgi:hypothetical protein
MHLAFRRRSVDPSGNAAAAEDGTDRSHARRVDEDAWMQAQASD